MDQAPYFLDARRRDAVLRALQEVCGYRSWGLLAAHVRTNHVHAVVRADADPERVMTDFKRYASRLLSELGIDPPLRKRWARHGSTRWLKTEDSVRAAVTYVLHEQGEAMAVFGRTASVSKA